MKYPLSAIRSTQPRRDHGDLEGLKASIREVGLICPVTVNQDFELLAGRRRFQALMELYGPDYEVDCYIIPTNGDPLRAFKIALDENLKRKNLSDAEEAVALKQFEDLAISIRGKGGQGQRRDLTSSKIDEVGWTHQDTAELIGYSRPAIVRAIKIATAIEEFPDLVKLGSGRAILSEAKKREPPTRWAEGSYGVTLVVGDAGVLPVADGAVHCFLTSPPYNIGVKTGHLEQRMGGRSVNGGMAFAGPLYEGEALEEGKYQQWQQQVLAHWHEKAAPGASLFYVHKVRQKGGQAIHPVAWLISTPWVLRQEVVWDRGSTHNHELSYFWPQDERIYWLTKGKPRVTNPEAALYGTVWQIPFQQQEGDWHPAPFPAELVRRCLMMATLPGDLVVDPFGGSMTTCRVAAALGRRSLGVDIREDYVRRAGGGMDDQ